MKFFGRKKEKNGKEEKREVPKRKRRTRKKEPEKPWGKKERLLVLIVLLLTIGSSAGLALSAREWKLPGLPRMKFQLTKFALFKEEKITIEGDRDKVRDIVVSNEVISKFKQMTNNLSGVYGLYVINLDTSYAYGVNETEVFQAASLIKLPVMAAMYMETEVGNIDLDTKYELKSADKLSGAGSLSGKPEGYEITYRDLIRLMGKQSDNTAFNIARNLLGDEKIDLLINKIGMVKTSLTNNETTAKDIGIFFDQLWNGNIVNKENRDELLDYLTDTVYEEWLAAGLPDSIRLAHKYGRETHVVNDVGIVFASSQEGRKPYVIVIMSKGVVEREADEIFPELSQVVYELEIKK